MKNLSLRTSILLMLIGMVLVLISVAIKTNVNNILFTTFIVIGVIIEVLGIISLIIGLSKK